MIPALLWRLKWPIAIGLAFIAAWFWHTGKVSQARQDERAACQARIDASIAEARQRDATAAQNAIQRAMQDARAANERALAAQQQSREAEDEVAALEPALRACRLPSDNDWRRLQ